MYTLLEECQSLVRAAKHWGHIEQAILYAFYNNKLIKDDIKRFDEIAEKFRDSKKSIYDINDFILVFKKMPWNIQNRFIEDNKNEDIIDIIKPYISGMDAGKKIYEENYKIGEEIFKNINFEEITNIIEKNNLLSKTYLKIKNDAIDAYNKYLTTEKNKILRNLSMEEFFSIDKTELTLKIQEQDECKKLSKEMNDAISEYEKVSSKTYNDSKKILRELREELLKHSSVSQEEANEWVEKNVYLDKSIIKFTKDRTAVILDGGSLPNPEKVPALSEIKNELATIYRITNGKLDKLRLTGTGLGRMRSYAEEQTVHWLDTDLGTLWHESGHVFEHTNPIFVAAAKDFIKSRATGSPQKLSRLTGKNYGNHEIAYPDNFSTPYVGKIYPDATEVISMGLQTLGKTDDLLRGAKDIEHLKFCFGCLLSDIKNKEMNYENISFSFQTGGKEYEQTLANLKNSAWRKAIDEAVTPEFIDKLVSSKGIEGFKLVEGTTLRSPDGAYALKYNKKTVAIAGVSEKEKRELAKEAYFAILNIKELVPEAKSNIIVKSPRGFEAPWFIALMYDYAPNWFTPLTELPRL